MPASSSSSKAGKPAVAAAAVSKPTQNPSVPHARHLLLLSLRYAISPKEYAVIQRLLASKAPESIVSLLPPKAEYNAICHPPGSDDYIPAATRAGLKVFIVSNILINAWDSISAAIAARRGKQNIRDKVVCGSFLRNPNFLFSLSLSTLVVLHRLLYRFFFKLRSNLSLPQARAFRLKHPKVSKLFLSPLSPAIGSSLAGIALLIHPAGERRTTAAVYTLVKALEYYYNRLEDKGLFQNRPWWFGSWLLFPFTSAQLLYAFVFDRDCFPSEYENMLLGYSKEYIQERPELYPVQLEWPGPYDVVDSISKVAGLRFPPFNSPILYPNTNIIPAILSPVSAILEPAHPTITSLQCALLHPNEPSCLKTYLGFWSSEFTRVAKFLAIIYAVAWAPRYKRILRNPVESLGSFCKSTFLTSIFITGTIGTSWAATCLFQKILPRNILPKGRFWLGGFLGGLWAFVDSKGGRANFLYSTRVGIISAWKVLVKKGLVKPMRNGDVYLFILSLAAINGIFDLDPHAVSGTFMRKLLCSIRGMGMRDPVAEMKRIEDANNAEKEKRKEKERAKITK